MSASALLLLRGFLGPLARGLRRLRAGTALRSQFPAQEDPRADEKGGADDRRRGERGKILHHERSTSAHVVSRGLPRFGAGMARHGDQTRLEMCPQ
jgi:hypothetical protein